MPLLHDVMKGHVVRFVGQVQVIQSVNVDLDSTPGIALIGAIVFALIGLFVAWVAGTRSAALLGMHKNGLWWFTTAGGKTQGLVIAYLSAIVAAGALTSLLTTAFVPGANSLAWTLAWVMCALLLAATVTRFGRMVRRVATSGRALDYADSDVVEPDDALDDVDVHAARTAATSGDWRPAAQLLAATLNQDVRYDRVRVLAFASLRRRAWLEKWSREEPNSADARAVRLQLGVEQAWQARGAESTPRNVDEFFRILSETESDVRAAIADNPNDPIPHIVMVTMARGQQVDDVEFAARWNALTTCAPLSQAGHEQALQYLAPKWFGTVEEMFAFARAAAATAPEGTALKLMPVAAHIERWIELEMDGAKDGSTYMTSTETRDELLAARDAWMAGPGAHPSPVGATRAHNLLAFAFWLAELPAEARPHLEVAKKYLSPEPWGYVGEPEIVHAHVQGWARRSEGVRSAR